jgi:cytochrome P450
MTQTENAAIPVQLRRDHFDPAAELLRLRQEAPVARTEIAVGQVMLPAWLVTRYDDVRAVLGDSTRFSNSSRVLFDRAAEIAADVRALLPAERQGMLLAYDPPDHTRLRRTLTGQFTVRRMAELEPRVAAIVEDHLEAMERRGRERPGEPVDLMQAFALPVPSLVICELLGVPYEDRADFQRRSSVQIDLSLSFAERMAAAAEAHEYMATLVAAQRRTPGDNLIGLLVREHGDALEDDELIGVASLLLIAGHETTASMIGLGTLLLLRHPAQLEALQRGDVPVDDAVEELLRHLTIVHTGFTRTALVDMELDGRQIRAGDAVICSLPLANRDDQLGDHLDDLDLSREPTTHLAFGHGIHHCLGAPLARMEMRLAFPALLRRFPALRLAVPFEQVDFRAAFFVYGLQSLPVTWWAA